MANQIIQLKIDVSKIDKNRLYKGKKGTYLTAALLLNDEADEYGNNGMIIEQISKEERESGHKGTILGNAKLLEIKSNNNEPKNVVAQNDGLPF